MKIHSFDAARREARKIGPQFELFGETYQLPSSVPVGAVLEAQVLAQADKEAEADVVALFSRMFGASRWLNAPEGWVSRPGYTDLDGKHHPGSLVTGWIDQGLDIELMVDMTRWAFEAYGVANKDGDEGDPTPAPTPRKVTRGKGNA